MLYALPAVNLIENCRFFVAAVRRDNDGHRLADSLFGGKAEKPFGGSVPAEDYAV